MPEIKSITFRDQIIGPINDLLIDEHKSCADTQNILNYLAGSLLNYKEEGIEFSPIVLFCDNIQDFLRGLPGSNFHEIGKVALDPASGPKILKDCAPLSSSSWYIFLERTTEKMLNYGVFSYPKSPLSITIQDSINIDPSLFCILIRKISSNTIEMRGSKGNCLKFVFSTTRQTEKSENFIELFSKNCCRKPEDDTENTDFIEYFCRMIETAVSGSHGTILICLNKGDLSQISELHDFIPVNPKLDFQGAFSEFHTAKTADSILKLQSYEQLLHGFLRCDGIVVFDSTGCVTAYRVFYKPGAPPEDKGDAAVVEKKPIVGGARRRAFEGVKELVGKQLKSALFRSQDGVLLYHGANQ